jgi:hypothetical protein
MKSRLLSVCKVVGDVDVPLFSICKIIRVSFAALLAVGKIVGDIDVPLFSICKIIRVSFATLLVTGSVVRRSDIADGPDGTWQARINDSRVSACCLTYPFPALEQR